MTSIMFGQLSTIGVPADEAVVRSTATPVEIDKPAAMQDDMPEMGELETDSDPDLGLAPRQMASKWIEGEQSPPIQKPMVDGNYLHNEIVDKQVSSSGTAASREAAGQWGHGSLSYAIGIEPVSDLTDGGKFGNQYFVREERPVQATMTDSMSNAVGPDQATMAAVNATGKANARLANQAALYSRFWNGGAAIQ
jgi:hypothetical protein